jgi:4-hydroxy-3-polyprenylbenzoate decarboxylase
MAYSGLTAFINHLEKENELLSIKQFVDPVLEITEIADRVTKEGGKALFFENSGTDFPVLINAFGSDKRMAMAIGREDLNDAGSEIENLFNTVTGNDGGFFGKLSKMPSLFRLAGILPSRSRKRGLCQQVVHTEPDLGILPVLKCWPHDGGRFFTLPLVHTIHPETGKTNVGMYRMQILDNKTTAMHWQRHKTGANHFEAWKKCGKRMPVSVALGGDPVYTYSATAPLPENIDEYILAGFLRKKKVRLVKCVTNDLYVPADADIVIEGFVDPSEELVWEGPFGDHTGFYSLADWYPKFHVTCITHSKDAVYPATIVGIPPNEDAWLAKTTEKLFLAPIKMAMQPEIIDFHMPVAGVAHNLVIVKITKTYPGQGMKVLSSLFGAGQMMFTKYLIVVSGNVDIRDYKALSSHVFENFDVSSDLLFTHGPLDVLDHCSDRFSVGGKAGIDATVKMSEEIILKAAPDSKNPKPENNEAPAFLKNALIENYNLSLVESGIPIVVVSVNRLKDKDVIDKVKTLFRTNDPTGNFRLLIVVDHTVNVTDLHIVAWQLLGNSDPERDHEYVSQFSLLLDGTIKLYRNGGFPRRWPNIVCSANDTISAVDAKWDKLGLGKFIPSPSLNYRSLSRPGADEVLIDK